MILEVEADENDCKWVGARYQKFGLKFQDGGSAEAQKPSCLNIIFVIFRYFV